MDDVIESPASDGAWDDVLAYAVDRGINHLKVALSLVDVFAER